MPKAKSVLSVPVQASVDELIAEMVRRYSEEEVADILRVGFKNATARLRRNRHERYKAECFFRRAATRLVKVPDDLASLVGVASQNQMDLFEEPKVEEPDPPSDQSAPEEEDVDAGTLFSPLTFEDLKSVFDTYPFAMVHEDPHEGRLLVLGYASIRQNGPGSPLIRQNVALVKPNGDEIVFRDIQGGLYPRMEQKSDALHMHIKVIPFPNGSGLRFWTNIEGTGDDQTLYRYRFCDNGGIFPITNKQSLLTLILKAQQRTTSQVLPS